MADISKELDQIMRARYGRDVRQSIHDGIQALNISAEKERQAAEAAQSAAETAQEKAEAARTGAETAQEKAEAARTGAETAQEKAEAARKGAETAQENAKKSADNAAECEKTVVSSAKEAESWTHGGTGTRDDENTDNAKYYKEKAQETLESLQRSTVTGIKGAAESIYRTGDVNLTPENIGAACFNKSTIDLSGAQYNQNTWYPVTGTPIPNTGMHRISLAVQLNSGTNPSWSEHFNGFSCNMEIWTIADGWGTTNRKAVCTVYDYKYCGDNPPHGYYQMNHSSTPVLWLRGGGRYFAWTDYDCEWVPRTEAYTLNEETATPTTNGAPFDFSRSEIYADLQGTATKAVHDENGNNIANTYVRETDGCLWVQGQGGDSGAIVGRKRNGEGVLYGDGNIFFRHNRYNGWLSDILNNLLPFSGGTMTNNLDFTDGHGIGGLIADNDYWRVKGGNAGSNAGYLEIATADDATEPIYVRQYAGVFNNIAHEICLLDESGDTLLGKVIADGIYFGERWSNNYVERSSICTTNWSYDIWIDGEDAPETQLQFKSESTHAELTMDPWGNRDVNLGSTDYRWDNIYATNGTIQTSDKNAKNTIEEITAERAQQLIYGLKPSTYKMNTGTSGRTHWGLISQDIEELFEEIGMTSLDFAGFIKTPKIVTEITTDDNTGKKQRNRKVIEDEYDYSLRYDEFIAPMIKVIQAQHEEIGRQNKKIETMEQRISILEQQIQGLLNKEEAAV